MTSTSEVGHNKNTISFQQLISFCIGFGSVYNPSATNLTLIALQALLLAARNAILATIDAFTVFKNATNEREILFSDLRKKATRVSSAIDACGATPQTLDDAKFYVAKLRGSSKKAAARKSNPNQPPIITEPGVSPPDLGEKPHSTSQQSFDSLIQHFEGLVQVATKEAKYNPNEADLKIASLNTLLSDLRAKNAACIDSYTAYSNARLLRDKILYSDKTGLTFTAKEVKAYIKSVFGSTSDEYKQVSAIKFTTRK